MSSMKDSSPATMRRPAKPGFAASLRAAITASQLGRAQTSRELRTALNTVMVRPTGHPGSKRGYKHRPMGNGNTYRAVTSIRRRAGGSWPGGRLR